MLRHLVRRLSASAATLLVITALLYAVVRCLPGEPTLGEEDAARAAAHGLPPIPSGYFGWLADLARFDFGSSLSVQPGRTVGSMVAEALPYTLALGALSLTLTLGLAIPLGVLSAWRPDAPASRGSGWLLYLLHALPVFWIALALQQLVAGTWRLLPATGPFPLEGSAHESATLLARLPYWILPTLAISLGSLAFVIRFCRAELIEMASTRFVRAARARGAGQGRVLWIHALAAGAVPLVSLLGLMLPGLLSGSVVVESIFALPGLGRLFFVAASRRDYPVVLAISLITAAGTLLANLLADLLYRLVDPSMSARADGPGRAEEEMA